MQRQCVSEFPNGRKVASRCLSQQPTADRVIDRASADAGRQKGAAKDTHRTEPHAKAIPPTKSKRGTVIYELFLLLGATKLALLSRDPTHSPRWAYGQPSSSDDDTTDTHQGRMRPEQNAPRPTRERALCLAPALFPHLVSRFVKSRESLDRKMRTPTAGV